MNSLSPFFINYILLLLTAFGMAGIAVWINRQHTLMPVRRLISIILIGALCLTIPGLFGLIGLQFIPAGYLLVQLLSLLLGIVFLHRMLTDMGPAFIQKSTFVLLLTGSTVCLGAVLFTPVFNYLSSVRYGVLPYDLWASTSLLPSVLPVIFAYTFNALVTVPNEIYKLWRYPRYADDIDMDSTDYYHSMILEIQVHKNPNRNDPPIKVKARTEKHVAFGIWFQKFIDDYNLKFPNDPIQIFDDTAHEYRWLFYSLKPSLFRLRNYIDFEQTIAQNNLNEKHLIIARRVEETA